MDAAILIGPSVVPVDSKFPLENFRRILEAPTEHQRAVGRKQFLRDVKKHIDAIASKYILPDEGTYDFALMYVPAENVYYETIIREENASEDRQVLTLRDRKARDPRVAQFLLRILASDLARTARHESRTKCPRNFEHAQPFAGRLRKVTGKFPYSW